MCGDDSNIYTRLPVLLAAGSKLPTVDFHHGAFDGRYLLEELSVRCLCGEKRNGARLSAARLRASVREGGDRRAASAGSFRGGEGKRERISAIFFSEPTKSGGCAQEEVYYEILPRFCRLARENGLGVIVTLHPFESPSERKGLVPAILSPEDHAIIAIVDGPLSPQLLSQAWCGITVESTTVMDCLLQGIPCFLCGWLALSSFAYVQQYARFGIGDLLRDATAIAEIPRRLAEFPGKSAEQQSLRKTVDPEALRQWLTAGSWAMSGARRVS